MNKLRLSWLASMIATFGSLYLSEVLKYIPCELCWFQRIFMYPLFIILSVALYKNDRDVVKFIIPLPFIGGAISLYHYLKQKVSFVDSIAQCTGTVPCNKDYINWFGFITIPFLALIAFTIIAVCFVLIQKDIRREKDSQ